MKILITGISGGLARRVALTALDARVFEGGIATLPFVLFTPC